MKRVLAISWEMPPMYGPRAVQVARTLAHLPAHGWTPTVVCMDPRKGGPHWFDGSTADANNVRTVRVPSPQDLFAVRALYRLVPALRDYPDTARVWIPAATRAAANAASKESFDALVSFAQPWSDHLIGLRVHRATKLPWIAHFSDPWADSPYATARQTRIWKSMEADVIREATAVVFVTQETSDLVMGKYPREWRAKVAVVPHGFDCTAIPQASVGADPTRALRVVYTGRFYNGLRTPRALLEALAQMHRRSPLAGSIQVSFIGPYVEEFRADAARLGVDSFVAFSGRVSAADAANAAAAADVLLLIDAPSEGPSVFLPSKLVDYLAFRKPILGLTPNGASASLLRRLGCTVAPPDDAVEIERAVDALLRDWRAGTLRVSESFDRVASEYDIRTTTRLFADVLTRACA